MYLVKYRVFSPDDANYDFSCVSNAITVVTTVPTYDPSMPPNYVLNFEGDISQLGESSFQIQ